MKSSSYRRSTKERNGIHVQHTDMQLNIRTYHNKKLSYRRGTARCVLSVKILPIATQVRNSAETTCTTSPEQIEVVKLERFS